MKSSKHYCCGMTLVELIVGLSAVATVSVAVTALLQGAARTSLFINSQNDAISQVETAYRRIAHNLRAASALTAPANTTPTSTLTLVTQPDPANGNATYTVTYTLSNGNLTESDPRYNTAGNTPNVLLQNVTTFSVTRISASSPTSLLVTITSGTSPPVTRSVILYCRNL